MIDINLPSCQTNAKIYYYETLFFICIWIRFDVFR